MKSLKGKRLLISGGPALACDIVEKARQLGIYTIVTDWYPDSPAKRIADESHMVSTADIDAMVELAKQCKVDGVITSFIDSNLHNVREVCERLNLPFYATKEQLDVTMNKVRFKELCRKHDVPVVEEFRLDQSLCREDLDTISYPVLLKPADSSGSRGIVVCKNEEELVRGYGHALASSTSQVVITERFMNTSVPGVNIDYVICNGKVYLSAVGDLFLYHENKDAAPLSEAVFYHSVRLDEYIQTLDAKVRKMFESIGLKNGTLYIQSFYDEEGFHFYEMGYRLGGGQSYRMISEINGINHLEMLIYHSLTGTMCDNEIENRINPKFDAVACGLFVLIGPGKICSVRGLEIVRQIPQVVNVMQVYYEGDSLPQCAEGTTQQVFARLHFVAKNTDELIMAIERAQSVLRVEDEDGKNMIVGNFSPRFANEIMNTRR
jgi:biotin carboxylase